MANDFDGLNKFLKDLSKNAPEAMADIVKETAYKVENKAKRNCPVDTGRLRGSITTKLDGSEAEVGTNVEYAAFVEYGTCKQSANPFMTTARQSVENELNSIIVKGVKSYLRT